MNQREGRIVRIHTDAQNTVVRSQNVPRREAERRKQQRSTPSVHGVFPRSLFAPDKTILHCFSQKVVGHEPQTPNPVILATGRTAYNRKLRSFFV